MSGLLGYIKDKFKGNNSAQIAKERLQIIVAHERMQRSPGSSNLVNLQELQQKLIDVIAEYLSIEKNQVNVELQRDANRSVLELNVTLPDNVSG
jgi:cell division topological specificity factor